MQQRGYIKLARKSIDSDIWKKPPLYWKIWCYILLKAYYEDTPGLKKGQLIATIDELREAGSYYIGYRKISPTAKEIRRVLDYLRCPHEGTAKGYTKGHMVGTTKVQGGMLINIDKYRLYQASDTSEGHNEGHNEGTHERTTKGQRGAHLNNKKNKEEKEKEITTTASAVESGLFQSLSIPSFEAIEKIIQEKSYNLDPETIYAQLERNDWMTAKGQPIKNLAQYIAAIDRTQNKNNNTTTKRPEPPEIDWSQYMKGAKND